MNAWRLRLQTLFAAVAILCLAGEAWRTRTAGAAELFRPHPPMRPLPVPSDQAPAGGPKLFVDAARGQDSNAGMADNPAGMAGRKLPAAWPNPLRAAHLEAPDIGALPLSAKPWGVGVDRRVPLFGKVRP